MKNSRDNILKGIDKSEDRLTAAKLLDRSEFSNKTNKPAHSDFLDPRQQKLAERVLKSAGITGFSFEDVLAA
jgi:RNA-binding protein YlmH